MAPSSLLFDPQLSSVHITPSKVSGRVFNTGHTTTFMVDRGNQHMVNITGGDLSYHYQVSSVVLHWGETPSLGSEHTVGGRGGAAELQILGYNGELYTEELQAVKSPHGGAGIAVIAQVHPVVKIYT